MHLPNQALVICLAHKNRLQWVPTHSEGTRSYETAAVAGVDADAKAVPKRNHAPSEQRKQQYPNPPNDLAAKPQYTQSRPAKRVCSDQVKEQ